MLKVIHFLRSMELEEQPGRMAIMQDLTNFFGQFPYKNPSVFNFYLPDYAPDAFPAGTVSPEFQIFDTPLVINFAKAMVAMIDKQGLSNCVGGFGIQTWGCKGNMR